MLNNQLLPTAEALLTFQQSEGVLTGLDLLTDTNKILKPSLEYIVPAQTKCYYGTLLFSNLANSNSQGNNYGKWLNVISFEPPEGHQHRGRPGRGAGERARTGNHLHYNPYPQTAAPGQDRHL